VNVRPSVHHSQPHPPAAGAAVFQRDVSALAVAGSVRHCGMLDLRD